MGFAGDALPLRRPWIEVAQIGVAVKDEVHPKLGIVEVIEHDERRASDWIYAKSEVGMWPFDCRKCCQDVFDRGIDAVALLGNDAHAKRLNALCEKRVELVEGSL
jgi:hypothetical protein